MIADIFNSFSNAAFTYLTPLEVVYSAIVKGNQII
jgi:hypothetical protein